MLSHLIIKNYVLIEHLEISPSPFLNIITGETGAGKSIILGAIDLLSGKRADSKVLFDPSKKCVIEGHFELKNELLKPIFLENDIDFEPKCIVRREISPSGKSRAFLNDTPVNLTILRQVSENLLDIHSQHDTILLASDYFQRNILDIFAQNQGLLLDYQGVYKQWQKTEKAYEELKTAVVQYKKELDYNNFLLEELYKANLDNLHQHELEEQLQILENAEHIKEIFNTLLEQFSKSEFSVENSLRTGLAIFRKISGFSDVYQQLVERLESVRIEFGDIVSEIEKQEENIHFDPENQQIIQNRLSQLYNLQNKHQVQQVADLLKIRQDLQQKVEAVLHFDEKMADLEKEKQKAHKKMLDCAEKLGASRRQIVPEISKNIAEMLHFVGLPNAVLKIDIQKILPTLYGTDGVDFLFSANKGVAPQALKNVASGGEFARLMLCLKRLLAGKMDLPTIIFDEIDTGISGEIAIKVSRLLKEMAANHQLFVISHLPQTAANGDAHYFVFKTEKDDRTISQIRKLDKKERIAEIAQMIGGQNPSKTAYKSAEELLEMY